MPTGKKPQKTNKTAHVLNLLAGDSDEKIEAPGSERLGADVSPLHAKPVQTAVSLDRAEEQKLEGEIKSALEEAFLVENLEQTKKEGQQETSESSNLQDAPQTEPEERTEAEATEQSEPKPAPVPVSDSLEGCRPTTEIQGVSCVNVMHALVEEKVDKYIRLFGLCTCPRCRIDVKALALSNLPAKYVVVGEQERIPMLSVYEGRYNAAVVSQVMWACKKVMYNPRHQL
ncbi:MAG: late competence development ComFB family protein [Lawsonibacter sp.]|nr:late competence development ComFB family protein [Lawsonibacter sp.]